VPAGISVGLHFTIHELQIRPITRSSCWNQKIELESSVA
jgi:hypothetical protein